MSKTRLYQMYDLTAEQAAGPILTEKRDGPAIRAFTAVLADPKTLPGQYPDHFALLLLGEQDEQSSEITAVKPVPILTGAAWLAQKTAEAERPQLALSPGQNISYTQFPNNAA